MKNILFVFLFGIIFCVSCDKIILDVDGFEAKIQGKWQLVPADTIYYNFQKNLFGYQIYLNEDSILSVYGYYTLLSDTAVYLELLCKESFINYDKRYLGSLDIIGWDTLDGGSASDTLYHFYKIKECASDKMILIDTNEEELIFEKF